MNPPIVVTKECNKNKSSAESDLKSKRKKNIQLIPLNNKHSYNMNTSKHPDIIDDEDIIVPKVVEPEVFLNQATIKRAKIEEQKVLNKSKKCNDPKKYEDFIEDQENEKKENKLSIGQWIKQERKKNNLTLLDLEKITNIGFSMIGNVETNNAKPSIENAIKLCEALDIDIHSFVEQLKKEVIAQFIHVIEQKYEKALQKYFNQKIKEVF